MTPWERWIMGWLEIAEGLVKVVTLGYLYPSPSWSFRWAIHCTHNMALRQLGKQVIEQQKELGTPAKDAVDQIIAELDRM